MALCCYEGGSSQHSDRMERGVSLVGTVDTSAKQTRASGWVQIQSAERGPLCQQILIHKIALAQWFSKCAHPALELQRLSPASHHRLGNRGRDGEELGSSLHFPEPPEILMGAEV